MSLEDYVMMMGIIITLLILVSVGGFVLINYLEKDTRQFCQACKDLIDRHEKGLKHERK